MVEEEVKEEEVVVVMMCEGEEGARGRGGFMVTYLPSSLELKLSF